MPGRFILSHPSASAALPFRLRQSERREELKLQTTAFDQYGNVILLRTVSPYPSEKCWHTSCSGMPTKSGTDTQYSWLVSQ
jgi:hypothetical protein